MKRITLGIVAGGAGVAAFLGVAAAHADTSSWTPTYDVKDAQLFAGPSLNSPAWELPASFLYGTGKDATTLTGTDYLMKSGGGLNDEFITKGGAIYDQNQLGGGFTNLYYDSGASGASPVDVLKTPFGKFDLSSAPSWAVPAFPTSTAEEVGHNVVITDGAVGRIGAALGLSSPGEFSGGLTDGATITPLLTKDSSLVWSAPASYTGGAADDLEKLTGNLYVTSSTDVEFVDKAGDVFAQNLWVGGLLPLNNLYYDPVGGPAQDYLQTAFGNINLSSIASWFAPADVADLTTPSPEADLSDAGLYSALDLGLPAA